MAVTRKEEARALDSDERELVERSHHPELQELPDSELSKLVKLVRDRRDKAKSQAQQRRREMRGKAAPRGAEPSREDAGSRLKLTVLAMAVRRLNTEAGRRRRMSGHADQVANSRRALALKRAAEPEGPDFNTRHAHHGMRSTPNRRAEDLVRPAELGRQRQAANVAQARRDG